MMISNWEIILRLILASVIGGLIGLEREVSNRPAGFRTHVLVCVGSTLIMLVSAYALLDPNNFNPHREQFRLAAQIVSGIGFLGAGTILKSDGNIGGLTTAASLWVVAGIGIAIGSGFYLGAIVTGGIVLISLKSLKYIERRVIKSNYKALEITGVNRPGFIGEIGTLLGSLNIGISDIKVLDVEDDLDTRDIMEVHFVIKTPGNFKLNDLIFNVYKIEGIVKVIYDGKNIPYI